MNRHVLARAQATAGFRNKFGRKPTLPEIQCLMAVGALETSYGKGWRKADAIGSNNIGAITAGGSWKGDTFEHRDSLPNSDGTNSWYTTKFRKYPTPEAGWEDLANIMYEDRPTVMTAASAGDTYGVSAAMYETRYYFGTGPDAKTRIGRHHTALMRNLIAQCTSLDEALPDGSYPPPPTMRVGSTGDSVRELQRLLGAVADGIFGDGTKALVQDFQRDSGLTDDGVVGPLTWAAIAKGADGDVVVEDEVDPLLTNAKALRDQLDIFIDTAG